MLRLFAHLKDHYLKVRVALPHENFNASFVWQNKIELQYTSDSKYTMAWTSLLPDLEPHHARALVELIGARYPVSSHYKELKKRCPELAFQNEKDEWVFYGGTFNPWHAGHQACLNLIPQDKTCFVLPDINPHKKSRDFELVSTVIALSSKIHFGTNQFLVPSFLIENSQNPTVEWIERMVKDFPEQKLSLLMGFDGLNQLHTWIRHQDLLPLLHGLYIVSRLETDILRDAAINRISKMAPHLKIEFLGRHRYEKLSSTDLRSRF